MATLEKEIMIAALAHKGQVDKAGEPYVLHPLRVMLKMSEMDDRIVAVLHDVVEDSHWTLKKLRAKGFSDVIVEAIDSLTKRSDESYNDFVSRAAANTIGRRVKLADIEDNSDLSRISNPTDRDYQRLEKYQCATKIIEGYKT